MPDRLVAERMPGFHWMTGYGDYTKELGYALRRVGIAWDNLARKGPSRNDIDHDVCTIGRVCGKIFWQR